MGEEAAARVAERIVVAELVILGVFGTAGNMIIARPGVDKLSVAYLVWVGCLAVLPALVAVAVLPRFERMRGRGALFALIVVLCYLPVLTDLRMQSNTGYPIAAAYVLFCGARRWGWIGGLLLTSLTIDLLCWPAGSFGRSRAEHAVYWMINNTSLAIQVCVFATFAWTAHRLLETRRDVAEVSVAQERLRAGRDVHDLLGFSLTVIVIRLEVVLRALRKGDVEAELELATGLVEQAIADVRTVGEGTPLTSLEAELDAAAAVLGWAGIDADVTVTAMPSPDADQALAYVLREAVTNVLRHSKADRCRIEVRATGLTVANDGLHPAPGQARRTAGGSGMGNLRTRLAACSGRLTAREEHGWFTLTARVPERRVRRWDASGWQAVAPTAGMVLALDGLTPLDAHFWTGAPGWVIAIVVAATVASYGILFRFAARKPVRRPRRLFAIQVCCALVPFLFGWAPYDQFATVAACGLVVLGRRTGRIMFVGAAFAGAWFTAVTVIKTGIWEGSVIGFPLLFLLFTSTIAAQLGYWLALELSRRNRELTDARHDLAVATVARERARFALHLRDRLGSGLHTVARSLDQARTAPDPESEILAAIRQARHTTQEIRTIARNPTHPTASPQQAASTQRAVSGRDAASGQRAVASQDAASRETGGGLAG
ncbi:hypothetical protein GCM10027589_36320 [Actinocorallia lasiicapitis]